MQAYIERLRLILLSPRPEWIQLFEHYTSSCEVPVTWVQAPSWDAARALVDAEQPAWVLADAAHLPSAAQCPLPRLLLLEQEPVATPVAVDDWLVLENLTPEVFTRCLRYAYQQSTQRRALGELTERDSLTGVFNRQGFQRMLNQQLAQPGEQDWVLGHLDLDNFRIVNDTLGQQAGDQLIQQLAVRLKSQLAADEVLARLGSDEFAFLLKGCAEPTKCVQRAEGMTEVLSEPYWVEGETQLLGCSLGLACASKQEGADALLWHANLAMQEAKRVEGCSYHIFDPRQAPGGLGVAELEMELRRALRRNELVLHYQPRFCLRSREVVGLEALVRWQHPERGLLGPDAFIPLAERSGLIVPLGYWVIAQALTDMQRLSQNGFEHVQMAINLSFRQFQDSQLKVTLERLIKEHAVDPRLLEFELTETSVMRRGDAVRETMLALNRLGVKFSLDDFGTGYSSFVHLDTLPITVLKIDRHFVQHMLTRPSNQKLVRAMVTLAHNLDLEVVAEGVETAAQLERLGQFNCDQIQGYLISRALPLAALEAFLKQPISVQA